eukprot:TRINITY_DN777991_c0_g1_i1.p1 TRINITY_DN777991_c0_g1~~TRINITY_DN777991_c0_g1_i1.p1  ORF type:complete len:592 (-),score=174.92 TRINITY_DN777991_c0_g1_i1:473-2248(-)
MGLDGTFIVQVLQQLLSKTNERDNGEYADKFHVRFFMMLLETLGSICSDNTEDEANKIKSCSGETFEAIQDLTFKCTNGRSYLIEALKAVSLPVVSAFSRTCARHGSLAMFEILFDYDPGLISCVGGARRRNPAMLAAGSGQVEILKFIASKVGIKDFLIADTQNLKSCHFAAKYGQLEATKFLWEQCPGAFDGVDNEGNNMVHNTAKWGHVEVLHFLHSVRPEMFQVVNRRNWSPFHHAAGGNHTLCMKFLARLAGSECFLATTVTGRSAAHIAASAGAIRALRLLWATAPQTFDATDSQGETLFNLASCGGHIEAFSFLHEVRPDLVNQVDNLGRNAAHKAAERGHCDVMRFIFENVPHLMGVPDSEQNLPAHIAAHRGHLDLLKALYEMVPESFWEPNQKGDLAAHRAYIFNECLEFLHSVVPKTFFIPNQNGRLPVHWSALRCAKSALQTLSKLVPETFALCDKRGYCPLALIISETFEEIRQIDCAEIILSVAPDTIVLDCIQTALMDNNCDLLQRYLLRHMKTAFARRHSHISLCSRRLQREFEEENGDKSDFFGFDFGGGQWLEIAAYMGDTPPMLDTRLHNYW